VSYSRLIIWQMGNADIKSKSSSRTSSVIYLL